MKLTSISGATLAAAAATLMIGSAAVVAQTQNQTPPPAQNTDGTVNCYIGDAKEPQAIPMSECEEKNGSLTAPGATAQNPAQNKDGTVNCFVGDAKEPQAIPMSECEEKNGSLTPPGGTTTAQQPTGEQSTPPAGGTAQTGGGEQTATVNCWVGDAKEAQTIPMSECEEKGGKLEPTEQTAVVKCYGINSCAGKSGCRTAHSECAGKNGCAGKGFVEVTFGQCTAQGGKVQPPA